MYAVLVNCSNALKKRDVAKNQEKLLSVLKKTLLLLPTRTSSMVCLFLSSLKTKIKINKLGN